LSITKDISNLKGDYDVVERKIKDADKSNAGAAQLSKIFSEIESELVSLQEVLAVKDTKIAE
jgi:hypothetical protein